MDDISHGSDNDTGSESNGGHHSYSNHYFTNNSSKSNIPVSDSNIHLLANSRLAVDLNLQQAAAHSHLLNSANSNRLNNHGNNSDLSQLHQLKIEPSSMFSNISDRSVNGTPVPSESGNDMNDTSGVVRTRRRKAGISEEDRLCVVCGEPASGYNFDRLTCESCKAFFRRNAFKMKEKIKACSRGGKCDVTGSQRKHCPSCRLDKCFASGMKKELILPPEKLEQRAKPRRRKHPSMSCDDNSGMPSLKSEHQDRDSFLMRHQMMGSTPIPRNSVASHQLGRTSLTAINQSTPQHRLNMNKANDLSPRYTFPNYLPIPSDFEYSLIQNCVRAPSLMGQQSGIGGPRPTSGYPSLYGSSGVPHIGHSNASPDPRNGGVGHGNDWSSVGRDGVRPDILGWESSLSDKDQEMYDRLTECLQRLREPFSPEEQLESSGTAETLEQAYNRMDTCIRRIIRVVKMIPYFVEIGKDAQIFILKANIYGLIILYSSFFFEKNISKLCYPIKSADGHVTSITVSMLDDVSVVPVAALASGGLFTRPSAATRNGVHADSDKSTENGEPLSPNMNDQSSVIREDFELYKRNTLAAFTELQDLANGDDYIRVCMLALKLFSTEYLPNELRPTVEAAQSAYLVFLQRYLTCRLGRLPAYRLYPRLLMAFIDIRTLEVRMTDFAKLLRLDGLSPLMREVITHR